MYKKKRFSSSFVLLAVIAAACGVANAAAQSRAGIDFVESYTPPDTKSQYVSLFKPYDEAATVRPKAITLAVMPAHELAKKTVASKIGGPTIISVPREVADTDTVAKTASRMQWTNSAQGNKVGSIRIKSTGAKGVFIGVLVDQLPPTAMLRFHGDNSSTAFHISAAEILSRIQTNINAGDKTDFGRTFWAPPLDRDDVTMEIELPAGVATDTVQISIPLISHVFTTSAELHQKAIALKRLTGAGTCNVDATCYPEYDNESRSVARLYFLTSPASAAFCTGTLLNNKFSDGTPYLLTANHCISTQTVASNLIAIRWLARTSACNSGVESTPIYQTGGGAILLHNNPQTDTSFLRLNEPPPSVVRFAGWSAEPVTAGEFALGLHNAFGELQEASLGKVAYYLTCTNSGGNCFVGGTMPTHIATEWTAGSIAGGSSGSGLFVAKNNARYLVGQLFGGFTCDDPFPVKGNYGRFDLAYKAALYQWLSPRRAMDISGDGKSDLIVQSAAGTTTAWLMNGSTISSAANLIANDPNWALTHTADFNGDGKVDLLWRHTDGRVALWLMNGSTLTSGAGLLGANSGWTVTHTGDFDGDGRADILYRHTDGRVALWLMNGTSLTSGAGLLGANSGWSVTHVADFNGDGRADILYRHTDGRVAMWLMNGTSLTSGAGLLGANSGWTVTHVADFNGDGKADILYRHTDGRVAIWLMNGTALTSGAGLLEAASGWTATHVADFNNDGKADILYRHTDGRIAMWLMNGTALTSGAGLLAAASGWTVTHTADFNGDGKADIVYRHTDGRVAMWLMNGTALTSGAGLTAAGTLKVVP